MGCGLLFHHQHWPNIVLNKVNWQIETDLNKNLEDMPIFLRNTRVADDPTNGLSEYPVPQLQIINDYFSFSLGNQMCVSVVYNQGETPARIMSSRLVFHLKLTKTLNPNTWILLLTRSA